MADIGDKKLKGALLDAFNRVERDLALLYGGSYFTEQQWIQIDFIIHQGKYVFTNGLGDNNSLIDFDFFAPLDCSSDCKQKAPETIVDEEDIDLLGPSKPRELEFTHGITDDFDRTILPENTVTSSCDGSEDSTWETATIKQETAAGITNIPSYNYDYPYALDGPWKPGQEVHVTLAALQAAPQTHKVKMSMEVGDTIKIGKNVSKHIFVGKNLRTGQSGQFHEEIFHLGDRASVEARLARVRGLLAANSGQSKMMADKETGWAETPEERARTKAEAEKERQRRLKQVDDHEVSSAAEWEYDEPPVVQPRAIREQDHRHLQPSKPRVKAIRTSLRTPNLMDSEVDSPIFRNGSPTPSMSVSVSAEAAEAIAALRSEIDARDTRMVSEFQRIVDAALNTPTAGTLPQPSKRDPRVCHYWATPGKQCKFVPCRKLHYFPEAEVSFSYRQKPQNVGQVNKKWTSQMDAKSALISTDKKLTCYFWWKNKVCTQSEELCKFSHRNTGEVAPAPFWYSNHNGENEDHGSSTSEEEHADGRSPVDSGGSGSDDNDGAGEEFKEASSMDVELGTHDDNDGGNQYQQHESKVGSTASGWGWAGDVNTAVETPATRAMIFGAAAGGWGDESMEAAADDGWNTVVTKNKGKSDKVVW